MKMRIDFCKINFYYRSRKFEEKYERKKENEEKK